MNMAVAVIGVLLAFVIMNYFIYKGVNVIVTSIIAAIVIIITNGMHIITDMNAGYDSVGGMLATFLAIFVFGGILAAIYVRSHAAASLSRLILMPFGHRPNRRVRIIGTLAMLIAIRVVIGLSGIDNMSLMPLMVALVATTFSGADMPRKYVNCVLMFAATIGTLIPGVPQQYAIILEGVLPGFDNHGNLLIRWILLIIYIVIAILWVSRIIGKDMDKGGHFEAGPLEIPDLEKKDTKEPHWILTFIPVVVVYVLYNVLAWDAWLALAIGCGVALILFFPYFPKDEGKKTPFNTILQTIDTGAYSVPLSITGVMVCGMVMAQAPGFNALVGWFSAIPIPAAFGLMLIAIVLVGATGAAQSALVIIGAIAVSVFIPNGMGIQAAGIIALWSTSVLDTLPNNLGIIMQCKLTGVPMKECYPSIFKTTLLLTLVMCLIVCIFSVVGLFG